MMAAEHDDCFDAHLERLVASFETAGTTAYYEWVEEAHHGFVFPEHAHLPQDGDGTALGITTRGF